MLCDIYDSSGSAHVPDCSHKTLPPFQVHRAHLAHHYQSLVPIERCNADEPDKPSTNSCYEVAASSKPDFLDSRLCPVIPHNYAHKACASPLSCYSELKIASLATPKPFQISEKQSWQICASRHLPREIQSSTSGNISHLLLQNIIHLISQICSHPHPLWINLPGIFPDIIYLDI